ncbi:hypothetical protein [Pseudonocardia sp. ICBG601]|uniref:hypothetical protein n=1 Tax=Pseudonocardia sp. ICBG601 TaxID=2846759 RepID=UPI001CF6D4BA|nr:hypothetical protein [Pseudonocardia sp. ICBG601]
MFLGGNATALLQDGRLAALQEASRTPLAVAVDEEAAAGSSASTSSTATTSPSARQMAASDSPSRSPRSPASVPNS